VPAPTLTVDGRRARRERGRQAVVDAVVDLLQEGSVPPRPDEVTARAGVSEATLFRYFDTLAELQHAAMVSYLERSAPLFEVPGLGEGALEARAHRLAAARVELYQVVGPVAGLARARAFDEPGLARLVHDVRSRLAEQVGRHFEPELDALSPTARRDRQLLIVAATSFESWDIHVDLGRSPAQIRRSWKRAVIDLCR
jgi:AcrR family transcriptional regulator